jgi:DNA-binding MarR family transcriptional regulator
MNEADNHMKNNYYINFLNLVKALEPSVEIDQIDVTSKLILDEIAICVAKEKPMTVSEIMGLKGLGSPATLHRKLTILLDAKLVQALFLANNRRTKYMTLTKEGEMHFNRLSQAMQSVQISNG